MKLLLASALASAALGLAGQSSSEPASVSESTCPPCPLIEDCGATIECLPDGTCRAECDNGEAGTCWVTYRCDGPGGCEILDSGGDCELGFGQVGASCDLDAVDDSSAGATSSCATNDSAQSYGTTCN